MNDFSDFYSIMNKDLALRPGWDGEYAPPPSKFAFTNAANALLQMANRDVLPVVIRPLVVGGYRMIHLCDRHVYTDFLNDGSILVTFGEDFSSYIAVEHIMSHCDKIKDYLYGE